MNLDLGALPERQAQARGGCHVRQSAARSTKSSLAPRCTKATRLASAPAWHAPAADMQAPLSTQCPLVYSHNPRASKRP